MTYKEIQDLIRLINKTNLSEFKMKEGDFELSIRTDKLVKGAKVQNVQTAPQVITAPIAAPAATAPAAPPVAPAVPSEKKEETTDTTNYLEVKSPIVGTFYRSSGPDKPAYAKIGDDIKQGDVVCIVEAMKLFNEIESEVSGKIVQVLVEDAQPVQYDQVLFLVDPS